MNNIFSLTKVFLKSSFYLFEDSKKKRGLSSKVKGTLFLIFIGICFLPTLFGIGFLTSYVCDMAAQLNMQNILPGLFLTIVSIATAIFALLYVINIFYFGNDNESIMHMPLKPYQILTARLITVLIYEYVTQILLVLVPIIIYGIKFGSFMYWIYATIIFFTIPLIPVILCSIIAMLIMPLLNISKNKDMVKILAGLVMILVIVGYSAISNSFATSNTMSDQGMADLLIKGDTSAFGTMSRIIPSVRFSALAIVNQTDFYGFLNMIIYLAVNVLGFIIFIALGQLLYLKGIKGLNQGYSKKGFDTSKIYEQSAISKNIMLSYAIKEFRILFRTPMYFLNCVLVSILLPVVMVTSLTFGKSSASNGSLEALTNSLDWSSLAAIVFALGFAMGVGVSSLNSIAASALSRDGHDFLFFKYAPLKIETQLWGKLIPALVLGVLGTLIMIIAACFFITVPLWVIFLVIPSIILGTFLQAFIGLTIDVLMPKLTWINEASAVKQNMNVLIAMAISIAIAAATVFLNIRFLTEMSVWMKISIFSLLFIALDIAAYKLLIFIANKRIPEIII